MAHFLIVPSRIVGSFLWRSNEMQFVSKSRLNTVFRASSMSAPSFRGYYQWSPSYNFLEDWTPNETLRHWILDRMRLFHPSKVHLCDGSEEENKFLINQMLQTGSLVQLNSKYRQNCYVARSTVNDVARVEENTYICSDNEIDAGPTNNWRDAEDTQEMLSSLFDGSMSGRTMYVIPFSMGPIGSPMSQIGVQITDSPYVVVNMRIMSRMGKEVIKALGSDGFFTPCIHSLGAPLKRGQPDTTWPCSDKEKWIVHFPEQRRIWSYGSGYGGNALLGKKCFALRIASAIARDEGWLAEHMLIVGVTNPQGVKKYFVAAFPSACGKTNMAMMLPKLPGWKVECVGDDIAWMKIGKDGRLWAINPEAGFFGVAPGTSMESNPYAMKMLHKDTIFTNVAITPKGDVWWEGIGGELPENLISWTRREWTPSQGFDAAHPNSRFTVPASQCDVIDPSWDDPQGVPISGIIFGGRRSTGIPLVSQARDWEHGTFMGAVMNSETTAAAAGMRGVLRADPFAMKPFCGYNMADYFAHWLSFPERTSRENLPKIFHVNWFRKGSTGKFMWPGFGDNIRVLEWIFNRCDVEDPSQGAVDSPLGFLPRIGDIDTSGLDLPQDTMQQLLKVDPVELRHDVKRHREFLSIFGDRLPAEIERQLTRLEEQVKD